MLNIPVAVWSEVAPVREAPEPAGAAVLQVEPAKPENAPPEEGAPPRAGGILGAAPGFLLEQAVEPAQPEMPAGHAAEETAEDAGNAKERPAGLPPLPEGLLSRLADDSFRVREAAEKELVEWAMQAPEASIEPLYELAMGHDEPEVRARALSALKAPIDSRYLQQGRGYVGITMNQIPAELPGGGMGVVITQVVGDSPAAGAGLQAGDTITAINGTGWDGNDAVDAFRARIQGMKPGTRVTLGILREAKTLDATLELGRLPPGAELPGFGLFGRFGGMPMMEELDFKAMEEAGKEEHFRQWLRERRAAR